MRFGYAAIVLFFNLTVFGQEQEYQIERLASVTKNMTDINREATRFELTESSLISLIFTSNGGVFHIGIAKEDDYWKHMKAVTVYQKAKYDADIAKFVFIKTKNQIQQIKDADALKPPVMNLVTEFTETNTCEAIKIGNLPPGKYVAFLIKVRNKSQQKDTSLVKGLITGAVVVLTGGTAAMAISAGALTTLKTEKAQLDYCDPDTTCKIIVQTVKQKENKK